MNRQRKLARAKLDRQLARRAERERRKRQLRAVAAGVTTLLVAVLGGMWIGGVFDRKEQPPAAANDCVWNKQNPSANTDLKDVGTPRTTGISAEGTTKMTIQFETGKVEVELDRSLAKCAAESLAYLASSSYYNGTKCHELTSNVDGQNALRCGDHSGTGQGGADYTFTPPENVPQRAAAPSQTPSASPAASASPEAQPVRYPQGTLAMQPGVSGSQFLIFFKDSPAPEKDYSVVGRVVSGLDVIQKIADAGTVDNGTKPKNDVTIQTLQVSTPEETPAPSTEPSTQPTSSATPSS
jgi:peptidyl-prolyl cis-trans isomerase B (cyclophilin B)